MNKTLSRESADVARFAGKNVGVIHPAWHSCGTYSSVVGQIAAYRAFGARVFPVAVSMDPGYAPERRWIWRSYVEATPELEGGERYFGGVPFHVYLEPRFLRDVVWPYIHGDQAIIRAGSAARAQLSAELADVEFDYIHCNHFFLMPIATRLARGRAPIALDSHDLQARQFMLMNQGMPWLRPRATYESMWAQELELMRGADLLFHVNTEEDDEFRKFLPENAHALLYPAGPNAPTGPGGPDIVIVASNNTANVESVIWFLREAAPHVEGVNVKIVGNVDAGVRSAAPDLFERYKTWFTGRVADLGAVYANARLVLLPTISGSGLSIKTLEALSSGLPVIATNHALRGMGAEAATLAGVTVVDEPKAFARALLEAANALIPTQAQRQASATRAFYEANFSLGAYERNLASLVAPLLASAK